MRFVSTDKHNVEFLFRESVGHPIFEAVLSVHRFSLLHANRTFDDFSTRKERWSHDRFAAMRDLF